jgi:heptaprenyl diphosphate synthase
VELNEIYRPIEGGLARVEKNILDTAGTDDETLTQLLCQVLKGSGKRIRPAITLLAGHYSDDDPEALVNMGTSVELLHTATLVHDDTVDQSLVRRGRPTINSVWGGTRAILLGDYLFARAATFVASTNNIRLVKLFAETIATIAGGELMRTMATLNTRQDRNQYFQWIGAKTACLFAAAAESGSVLTQATEEKNSALRDYGYNLGMAFQLVDDILDFTGKESVMGKPAGADLSQGTLTLPTILFLEHYPDDQVVKDIVKGDGAAVRDAEAVRQALDRIREPDIIRECLRIATDFCNRSLKALNDFPDGAPRRALRDLVDYNLYRSK